MDVVSNITNIVVAVSALCTAVVAIRGVNSWRKEQEVSIEVDLARKYLKALYSLKKEIGSFRNAVTPSWETGKAIKDLPEEKQTDDYSIQCKVYDNRLEPVKNKLNEFYELTIEAKILWGKEADEIFGMVNAQVGTLFFSIKYILDKQKNPRGQLDEEERKELTEKELLFFGQDEADNKITKAINDAITRAEKLAYPVLKTKYKKKRIAN